MKTITRKQFDEMGVIERRDFIKAGGRLVDPVQAPNAKPFCNGAEKVFNRAFMAVTDSGLISKLLLEDGFKVID